MPFVAHVLRADSGDAVLLSVDGETLQALFQVLQEPLAGMAGSFMGTDAAAPHALFNLVSSAEVLPEVFAPGIRDAMNEWKAPQDGDAGSRVPYCMRCLKEFGQRRTVVPGSACGFCNCVQSPFGTNELYCPCCGCDATLDLGGACSQCSSQRACTLAQIESWPFCASCTASGRQGYMHNSKPCMRCHFNSRGKPTCNTCGCCDVCSVRTLHACLEALAGRSRVAASQQQTGAKPYLITNSLEVFEASKAKEAELVASCGIDGQRVSREQVTLSSVQLREMLFSAFIGSTCVVTRTFPPREHHQRKMSGWSKRPETPAISWLAGDDADVPSDTGSDDSFMLLRDVRDLR